MNVVINHLSYNLSYCILLVTYYMYVMMYYIAIVVCSMVYDFVHFYCIFYEYVSVYDSSLICFHVLSNMLFFLQIISCPFLYIHDGLLLVRLIWLVACTPQNQLQIVI